MRAVAAGVFVLLCTLSLFCHGPAARAEQNEGGALFESLKCGLCHKPEKRTAGTSLKEIAEAYGGDQERMVVYLKGEAPALIDLGKAKIMERQLRKTKDLSPEERQELADYLVNFK